jgi:hypothetical protein
MPGLLDRIQQIGAAPKSQQKGIEQLLRAKKGKAGAPSGPAASGLAAQAAATAGGVAARQQTMQERLAGAKLTGAAQAAEEQQAFEQQKLAQQEQLAQQQMQTAGILGQERREAAQTESRMRTQSTEETRMAQLNSTANNRLRDLASQRGIKMNDIFANAAQERMDLELRQDAAQLETQAHLLAMQDKEYMAEMAKIAAEQGLRDEQAWETEAMRILAGRNYAETTKRLEAAAKEDAKKRQADLEMSIEEFEVKGAIQRMEAAAKDDAEAKIMEGIMNIGIAAGTEYLPGLFDSSDAAGFEADMGGEDIVYTGSKTDWGAT